MVTISENSEKQLLVKQSAAQSIGVGFSRLIQIFRSRESLTISFWDFCYSKFSFFSLLLYKFFLHVVLVYLIGIWHLASAPVVCLAFCPLRRRGFQLSMLVCSKTASRSAVLSMPPTMVALASWALPHSAPNLLLDILLTLCKTPWIFFSYIQSFLFRSMQNSAYTVCSTSCSLHSSNPFKTM